MGAVEFVLGPSRFFIGGLLLMTLGSACLLFWMPIPFFFKIVGLTLLILYSRLIWNLHARRIDKASVIRIWQDSKGHWGYQTREGRVALGELKGDSFKNPWFIILRFRFKTHHRSVFVPRDAFSSEEYRVLCMRLNLCTPAR